MFEKKNSIEYKLILYLAKSNLYIGAQESLI